jgi:hypothetical protein
MQKGNKNVYIRVLVWAHIPGRIPNPDTDSISDPDQLRVHLLYWQGGVHNVIIDTVNRVQGLTIGVSGVLRFGLWIRTTWKVAFRSGPKSSRTETLIILKGGVSRDGGWDKTMK